MPAGFAYVPEFVPIPSRFVAIRFLIERVPSLPLYHTPVLALCP